MNDVEEHLQYCNSRGVVASEFQHTGVLSVAEPGGASIQPDNLRQPSKSHSHLGCEFFYRSLCVTSLRQGLKHLLDNG